MLRNVERGPGERDERPFVRLLDWLAGFGYALGWFVTTKKFLDVPFRDSGMVGYTTVEEIAKLQDYIRAGLFYIFVPILTIAFSLVFGRIRRRSAWSGVRPVWIFAAALPFILSAPLYLVTGKELWSLLLPLVLGGLLVWVEPGWDGREWLQKLLAQPSTGVVVCEAFAWILARYLIAGRRIAHMESLLLEVVLVALWVTAHLAVTIALARFIADKRDESTAVVFERLAIGALPLVLLAPAALWPERFALLAVVIIVLTVLTVLSGVVRWRASESRPVRVLVWVAVPLLFVVLGFGSTADPHGWVDLFHRGESLGPASDYLAGERPYVDIFPLHGLLEDGLLDASLMKVFGRSDEVAAHRKYLLSAMMIPAIWILGWWAFRSLPLALVSALLALVVAADNQRAVLEIFVAGLLLAGIAERKRWAVFLAGLVGGIDLFFSLETGIYCLAGGAFAIIVTAAIQRSTGSMFRNFLVFIGGFVAGSIPFLVYLGFRQALAGFFAVSFREIPRVIDAAWSLPFPDIGPWLFSTAADKTLFQYAWHLRYILNPAVIVVGLITSLAMILRRPVLSRSGTAVVTLTGFALVSQRSALGRADLQHQWFAAFFIAPLIVALVVLWMESSRDLRTPSFRTARNLALGIGAVVLFFILWAPGLVRNRLDGLTGYRARITGSVTSEELSENRKRIEAVSQTIDSMTPTDTPIFDFSNQPALYFFADRRNPTRFFQVPLMSPAKFQREVIADLERSLPALVVMSSPDGFDRFDGVSNRRRAPNVARWIESHYGYDRTVHGVEIWTRLPRPVMVSAVANGDALAGAETGRGWSVLPAAGRIRGVSGTWRTDLLLINRTDRLASVRLRFDSNRGSFRRIVNVDPEARRRFDDVTTELLGAPESVGPLWIEYLTDVRPEVEMRSRSTRGGRSPWIPALDPGEASDERLEFYGLIASPGDRMNLSLVNTGYGTATVDVIARDPEGDRTGGSWRATIPEHSSVIATGLDGLLNIRVEEEHTIEAHVVRGEVAGIVSVIRPDTGDSIVFPGRPVRR